jgi:hypothetical protein
VCFFCGDPDPTHGLGPFPLMLAAAGTMQVYTKVVRSFRLRRAGAPPPAPPADAADQAPEPHAS